MDVELDLFLSGLGQIGFELRGNSFTGFLVL